MADTGIGLTVDEGSTAVPSVGKRYRRFRSKHHNHAEHQKKTHEREELNEMIFLRDLHFGFLPDDCETEFTECFKKVSHDPKFATKCFHLALLSRNEDLVRILLDHLIITRDNFHSVNQTFLDPLVLEAVELDDLESIQSILAWRDSKAAEVCLTAVDKKLLKMHRKAQEVMVSAAVRNNYSIIKCLYADGYRIYEGKKAYLAESDSHPPPFSSEDMMARHIERILSFKAKASPAYLAMTYSKDPVEHAFDFTRQAEEGARQKPEFRAEFDTVRANCRAFAVSVLDSCRNSAEVEQVLHGGSIIRERPYARLYRALLEEQKEFVAHPYCQVLLRSKWLSGSQWPNDSFFMQCFYVVMVVALAPVACPLYMMSPHRNHSRVRHFLGPLLRLIDKPINRFILDMASYFVFLVVLLLSVVYGVGDHRARARTWYFDVIIVWIFCHTAKLFSNVVMVAIGRLNLNKLRFFYDFVMVIIFQDLAKHAKSSSILVTLTDTEQIRSTCEQIAIAFKWYGYSRVVSDSQILMKTEAFQYRAIHIGANLYGVAACMAFLKLIFHFEIHHRFGPILFCIRNVFWDITSVMGSFIIAVFAFGVGLVAVFGMFEDEQTHFSDFGNAFKTLFWIIFDPGKEEYADILPPEEEEGDAGCCCDGSSSRKKRTLDIARNLTRMFLPLNKSEGSSVNAIENGLSHDFGIYIWGFYQVLVVLIMLNLLISLMTTTFSRIQQNADVEWKFTRASLWIHYFEDLNSLPVPFNAVPSVYTLMKLSKWWTGAPGDTNKTRSQGTNRKLYDMLIERAFRTKAKRNDQRIGKADLEALEKEISIDVADLRRDIRNLRRDLGITTVNTALRRDDFVSRKVSASGRTKTSFPSGIGEQQSTDAEEEEESTKSLSRYALHPSLSFKVDENPAVVKHLVQTLGLIGTSYKDLDILGRGARRETPDRERHNSLI